MKVHTEWRPGTDIFDIWIFQDGRPWHQLILLGPDDNGEQLFEWREVKDADRPKPSLTLPGYVYEALTAKLNGVLPASEATERHLKDAIEVRDRLMGAFLPEKP